MLPSETFTFGGDDHTFKDPDSGRVVVDSSRGSQSCGDDGWGGNKIVGKGVV